MGNCLMNMSGRQRDIGRHYSSGSSKRKAKEEKEMKAQEAVNKTRKLTDFFSKPSCSTDGVPIPTPSDERALLTPSVPAIPNLDQSQETQITQTSRTVEFSASDSLVVNPGPSEQQTGQSSFDKSLERTTVELEGQERSSADMSAHSNDLGKWPEILSETDKEFWISQGAEGIKKCQNKESSFKSSARRDELQNTNRYCKKSFFTLIHDSSQKVLDRNWLCFSESKGKLFCFPCKLLTTSVQKMKESMGFASTGFCDWKHAVESLSRHEKTSIHANAMFSLSLLQKKAARVDHQVVEQLREETLYWESVLTRVVEVIKFLAERGLPLRGSDEKIGSPHNGNYLGVIEVLAKFDPFLNEHLKKYANRGKGSVSYMSKTIYEEFMDLIAKSMIEQIVEDIKTSKYFSISLDSTPDVSHSDQLCLIIRYIKNTEPVEKFIIFLESDGHDAESMYKAVSSFMEEHGLNIQDCRGQSYDNASNMSGKYNGLQAKIKQVSPYAEYIPCFAHSLNLVGQSAAESCSDAVKFFLFVENLYVFFSSSTHRWKVLKEMLPPDSPVVKQLSETRWSARAEAVTALARSYHHIRNALQNLANDINQKPETKQKATGLINSMDKLETCLMIVIWRNILERVNAVSLSLQSNKLDLNRASALIQSLKDFITSLRTNEEFIDMEKRAKEMTNEEYQSERKRNRKYDCSTQEDTHFVGLSKSEKFRVGTYFTIIDNLVSALHKRHEAYNELTKRFGVFSSLTESKKIIKEKALYLLQKYPQDLEPDLTSELEHLSDLLRTPLGESLGKQNNISFEQELFSFIVENSLCPSFPNVVVSLTIYLSLMVTNCSGERSFSKLKRVKNYLRSTMGQERLNSLTLMSIETETLRGMDTGRLISLFAARKARKYQS